MTANPEDFVLISFEEPFQLEPSKDALNWLEMNKQRYKCFLKLTSVHLSAFYFLIHYLGSSCAYDYVRVFEVKTNTRKATYCGNGAPSSIHLRGETKINFITDHSRLGKGFHLRYEIQPCGGLITEDATEIRSPAHVSGYLHNLNCTWTIQAPVGKVVELK